jgi:hypothetical protein
MPETTPELKPLGSNPLRVYGTNVDSLKKLELSCERDEATFVAKVISLQLAIIDNNVIATAVQYQEVDILDDINLGHLILSEFTDDVDKQSQITIHQNEGKLLVCEGKVYVKNKPVQVLLFREKT